MIIYHTLARPFLLSPSPTAFSIAFSSALGFSEGLVSSCSSRAGLPSNATHVFITVCSLATPLAHLFAVLARYHCHSLVIIVARSLSSSLQRLHYCKPDTFVQCVYH